VGLEVLVNDASMLHRVKRDEPLRVVNPKEDAVVAHSVFVQTREAGRQLPDRFREPRVGGQSGDFFLYTLPDGLVEFAEGALEVGSRC
jgi:hypothetical protein